MADGPRDYEVGYGKPPKHSQFKPGESGRRRGKRRRETKEQIVARVRDEKVGLTMKGKRVTMSNLELVLRKVHAKTMESGKPQDLVLFLALLEKYGGIGEDRRREEAEAGADAVIRKIMSHVRRTSPKPRQERHRRERELVEVAVIQSCQECSTALRSGWHDEDCQADPSLLKTRLRQQFEDRSPLPPDLEAWPEEEPPG